MLSFNPINCLSGSSWNMDNTVENEKSPRTHLQPEMFAQKYSECTTLVAPHLVCTSKSGSSSVQWERGTKTAHMFTQAPEYWERGLSTYRCSY